MKEQTVLYHVGYLDKNGSFWSRRETEFKDYAIFCVSSFLKDDPKKDWVVVQKIIKSKIYKLVGTTLVEVDEDS